MTNKKYSISELINENIRLKKQLEHNNIKNMEGIINILEFIKPYTIRSPLDLDKIIEGFKSELEKTK